MFVYIKNKQPYLASTADSEDVVPSEQSGTTVVSEKSGVT